MRTKKPTTQLTQSEIAEKVVKLVEIETAESLACLPEESVRQVLRQVFKTKAYKDPALELVRFIVTFPDHAPPSSGRGQEKTLSRTVQAPGGVH